jgi:hypothetical protein
MLVPGSITFLIAGLVYLHRWLGDETREVTRPARTLSRPAIEEQPA